MSCACDLKRHAKWASDWQIARLVGSATYAQLLDSGPGVFEPFADHRSGGNSASSLNSIFSFWRARCLEECYDGDGEVPTPPNLVSTVLADGGLSVYELKRHLIRACVCGCVHPAIEPLVGSSVAYTSPVMSLGEVVATFIIIAIVVSTLIGILLRHRIILSQFASRS